jgi:hypothetical protein
MCAAPVGHLAGYLWTNGAAKNVRNLNIYLHPLVTSPCSLRLSPRGAATLECSLDSTAPAALHYLNHEGLGIQPLVCLFPQPP